MELKEMEEQQRYSVFGIHCTILSFTKEIPPLESGEITEVRQIL